MLQKEIDEKLFLIQKTLFSFNVWDYKAVEEIIPKFEGMIDFILTRLGKEEALNTLVIYGLFFSSSLAFQPCRTTRMKSHALAKTYLNHAYHLVSIVRDVKELPLIKDAIQLGDFVLAYFDEYESYHRKVTAKVKLEFKNQPHLNTKNKKKLLSSCIDDREKIASLVGGLNRVVKAYREKTNHEILKRIEGVFVFEMIIISFGSLVKTVLDYLIPFYKKTYRDLVQDDLVILSQLSLIEIKMIVEVIHFILARAQKAVELKSEFSPIFSLIPMPTLPDQVEYFKNTLNSIDRQISENNFKASCVYTELMEIEKYKQLRLKKYKNNIRVVEKNSNKKNKLKNNKENITDTLNVIEDEAVKHAANGDFVKAIACYKQQLNTQNDFRHARIHIFIGECYFNWNKFSIKSSETLKSKAQEHFSTAEKLIAKNLDTQDNVDQEEWKVLLELHRDLLTIFLTQPLLVEEYISADKIALTQEEKEVYSLRSETKITLIEDKIAVVPASFEDLLPQTVKNVMQYFNKSGHLIFAVGGCVRDFILKNEPRDFDLVTSAMPNESKAIMGAESSLVSGNFPTVKWQNLEICTLQGKSIQQVVTLDNGVSYLNHFGQSIKEDSERRDITIHALYYVLNDDGRFVYDPTNQGLEDLVNKIIRMVNPDPVASFTTDPIRILRVLRFEIKLGFTIEEFTKEALLKCKSLLSHASPARILLELQKIFSMKEGRRVLQKLESMEIMNILFVKSDKNCFINNKLLHVLLSEFYKGCVSDHSAKILILMAIFFHEIELIRPFNQENLSNKIEAIIRENSQYFNLRNKNLDSKFKNILLKFYFPNMNSIELKGEENIILYQLREWLINFKMPQSFGFFGSDASLHNLALQQSVENNNTYNMSLCKTSC